MRESVEKFENYLEELGRSYFRLLSLLERKLAAISEGNLATLEGVIKEEQAYVMLSKGFDNNLRNHRERMGVAGDTLAQVIEELPEEYRGSLKVLHHRLQGTLAGVQRLNQQCQALLGERLHQISRSIQTLDPAETPIYQHQGAAGGAKLPGSSLFSKTI